MPTQRKVKLVAEIEDLIRDASVAISTNYQGMSMAEQNALRKDLAQQGLEMRVVKNTLLRLAAERTGRTEFAQLSDGPTALVIGRGDPVPAARAVVTYKTSRRDTRFEYRTALIDGAIVDADYIRDLATVPPREELLAKIAGGLTGKLVEFMGLIEATTREFAGLVEARANQLEEGAGS